MSWKETKSLLPQGERRAGQMCDVTGEILPTAAIKPLHWPNEDKWRTAVLRAAITFIRGWDAMMHLAGSAPPPTPSPPHRTRDKQANKHTDKEH